MTHRNPSDQELLSALADGELDDCDIPRALDCAGQAHNLQSWQLYHLVGEVLRSPDLAQRGQHDLLAGFRAQLAQDRHDLPVVQAPGAAASSAAFPITPASATREDSPRTAANDAVFRWKAAAGFASVAAIAAIGWNVLGFTAGAGGAGVDGGQWAASAVPISGTGATSSVAAAVPTVTAPAEGYTLAASVAGPERGGPEIGGQEVVGRQNMAGSDVMLRDPLLDALLAKHQQYANRAALQPPADFLRNAGFRASHEGGSK